MVGLRKEDLYSVCSVCKKVDIGGDSESWEHIHPIAYETLGNLGELSHGYCPDCFSKVMAEMEELSKLTNPKTIK